MDVPTNCHCVDTDACLDQGLVWDVPVLRDALCALYLEGRVGTVNGYLSVGGVFQVRMCTPFGVVIYDFLRLPLGISKDDVLASVRVTYGVGCFVNADSLKRGRLRRSDVTAGFGLQRLVIGRGFLLIAAASRDCGGRRGP